MADAGQMIDGKENTSAGGAVNSLSHFTLPEAALPYTGWPDIITSLDRAAHLRRDPQALQRLRDSRCGHVIVHAKGRVLLAPAAEGRDPGGDRDDRNTGGGDKEDGNRDDGNRDDGPLEPCLLAWDRIAPFMATEPVFLGLTRALREEGGKETREAQALFAVDLGHLNQLPDQMDRLPAFAPLAAKGAFFEDLRRVSSRLHPGHATWLAWARGILNWLGETRFCCRCGSPLQMRDAGHLLVCSNRLCGASHFPRTDPAVIMLVVRPDPDGDPARDRCLLARSPRFPDGMYSTLAGFVEPGESLEDAVIREVREEVGIVVQPGGTRCLASQPWPFPRSLMIGFMALAASEDITRDPEEIEDAFWISRAELNARPDLSVLLPRADSIARAMVDLWRGG